MKSYRSIRFLTCLFVILSRLTWKNPTSGFPGSEAVSKTEQKNASVRPLLRDPLREAMKPKFENFHLGETLKIIEFFKEMHENA